ncbi:MAG: hypothetical protein R3286_02690 [Gammaproteobacteria bacterium]|nr:hypothetical protein [Gammaproteobacteria bacterium]
MRLAITPRRWRLAASLAAAVLLIGCSGAFTYPNTHARNLRIHTHTDSGSPFSSVHAALGIYEVDANCRIEYRGSVDLDQDTVDVGIPSNRPSYLVFEFYGGSFLAGSSRSITWETLLEPATGRSYDIEVSYVDDIYDVRISESRPGSAAVDRVERRDLRTCASA